MADRSPGRCVRCTRCCHHVSLQIDTPEDDTDFDNIRWYLLHENVKVFVDGGDWYLEFATPCAKLSEEGCIIYENRPSICADYDPENCERHGEYWDVLLENEDDLKSYLSNTKE